MEPLWNWFVTLVGEETPVSQGRPVPLNAVHKAEVRALLAARQEFKAIREVRGWTGASLADAVATVNSLKTPGQVPPA